MTILEYLQQEYDAIIKKYGYGVRPSWVSEELAHLGIRIQREKEKQSD